MVSRDKTLEGIPSTAREKALTDLRLWEERETPGLMAMAWQRFRRDKLAMLGGAIMIILVLAAISAPLLSKYVTHYTPQKIELGGILKPPGYQKSPDLPVHVLGTDELGRDVLTRIIYGGRVSLYISFLTVLVSLTIGTILGAAAGFYGGVVDTLLMRFVDIVYAIPGLFLLILISVVFRPGVTGMAFVLASLSWIGVSRLVRGEFLSLKARDFVDAARVVGAGNARLIFRHILPNATSPIIVAATLAIGNVILTETALSFLGMGVQPPTPSWGNMLTNAQQYLYRARHLIVIPGFFIFITVLAGNLMGNGLRDALDPRLRE
jgi:peptide/nickel transport system permease protein